EQGAAVIEQVELDIASALDQLRLAVVLAPRLVHPPTHDLRIDAEESLADRPREGEVGGVVAAVQMVVEDAADAARLIAVGQVEIVVAPRLETPVIGRIGPVAGRL